MGDELKHEFQNQATVAVSECSNKMNQVEKVVFLDLSTRQPRLSTYMTTPRAKSM